jgi:hypothetical protein
LRENVILPAVRIEDPGNDATRIAAVEIFFYYIPDNWPEEAAGALEPALEFCGE